MLSDLASSAKYPETKKRNKQKIVKDGSYEQKMNVINLLHSRSPEEEAVSAYLVQTQLEWL